MLIVHRRGDGEREVDLAVVRGPMLLGDVAVSLGEDRRGLLVDGVPQGGDMALSASVLVRGSRLEALPPEVGPSGRSPSGERWSARRPEGRDRRARLVT